MTKICCIVGGVPTERILLPQDCLLIGADKGYETIKSFGSHPDIAVGDFDSLGYIPEDVEVIRHPVEKDDTDTLLAVKEGFRRRCKVFLLYGCIGGDRLDHTLANLQTLCYIAASGGIGFMTDGKIVCTVIHNGKLMFDARETGNISVFCMGTEAEGVDIKGLRYSLSGAVLTGSMPLGVSNHFEGKPAVISVQKGDLLVLWEKKTEDLIRDLDYI